MVSRSSNQTYLASMTKNGFFFQNWKVSLSWISWFLIRQPQQGWLCCFLQIISHLHVSIGKPEGSPAAACEAPRGLGRNMGCSVLWEIPWCWELFRQWYYSPDFWTMHLAKAFRFFSPPNKPKRMIETTGTPDGMKKNDDFRKRFTPLKAYRKRRPLYSFSFKLKKKNSY